MKYQKNKFKYNFFLRIILLLIFIDNSSSSVITGKYPFTKRLNNGNYVIVSSRNITFVDPAFSIAYNSLNFESEILSNDDWLGSTLVSQFSASHGGYVVVILVKTLYIFSSIGEYLNEVNITLNSPKFFCHIITHANNGNNYFMTLISGSNDEENIGKEMCKYINFRKITYDSQTNKIIIGNDYFYTPFTNENFFGSLSCNMMLNSNKEYIVCIYGKWDISYISIFDPDDSYKLFSTKSIDIGGQFFKSAVLPEERKIIFICGFKSNNPLYCLSYDITENTTTSIIQVNGKCGNQPINLIMEYFYETENFIAGCKEDGNVVYLTEFSKEIINITQYDTYDTNNMFLSNSGNIGRINIIFPQGGNKYNFFYNPNIKCNGNVCPVVENQIHEIGTELSNIHAYPTTEPKILICSGNLYYNYEHSDCISTIPSGFYCNSTSQRTIDRCHPKCQTCNKSSSSDNHNCLKCSTSETLYFDFGNCVTECFRGHFSHNGIEKCKCSTDTTCEYCSEESKRQNLCETCNENYYPKKDDSKNNGTLIKCYNDESISSGYYLNKVTSQYEPCHSNCLKCSEAPTDSNDNCQTCKEGYSLIKNNQNIENCYPYCNNYYYFDENNEYHCNTSCPEGYKLIEDKGKCIDDCSNDNIYNYRYEYNNVCYQSCPTDTTSSRSNEYLC